MATDLGDGVANAISTTGQVVGSAGGHAFSWSEEDGKTDLGTLPGGSRSEAVAVSSSGQVVGWSDAADGRTHAFSWTTSGGMIDLGGAANGLVAVAVDDDGQVLVKPIGLTHSPGLDDEDGYVWTQQGGKVEIPGYFMVPYTMSGSGQVVGFGFLSPAQGPIHAFSWTRQGGIVELGTDAELPSAAYGVADSGEVVGWEGTTANASGPGHSFTWTEAGGRIQLPLDLSAIAYAVNEAGQVVGTAYNYSPQNPSQASGYGVFSWTPADGAASVGTLGGSASYLGGSPVKGALSENGQVVGSSDTASGERHAFSWTLAGGLVDLGAPGGTYASAQGVNDSGQVVGFSSMSPGSGGTHAILWQLADSTPPPVPSRPDLTAASDAGVSSSDNVTNETALAFAGTARPGLTITLHRDGHAVDRTTADVRSGAWMLHDTVSAGGTFRYTATAADAAGRVSTPTEALPTTVDTSPPTLNISGAATNSVYTAPELPARPMFQPSDTGSGIAESHDDWTTPGTSDGSGTYTYSAEATDVAGSTSSETRTYTVHVAEGSAGGGGGGGGGGGPTADLAVEGSVAPQTARQGDTLVWMFRVVNANLGPAVDVYLDLRPSDNLTVVSSTTTRGPGCLAAGTGLHCFLDWMSGDASTATVTLATTVATAGDYAVTATVGQLIADAKPENNTLVLRASAPAPAPAPPAPLPLPVVKPVIAAPVVSPAGAHAGKRMVVVFAVTRSDNHAPLTRATMVCDPSVAGKVLGHTESFRNGKARLAFTVPKNARGKQLRIKVTIRTKTEATTRVATFRVH